MGGSFEQFGRGEETLYGVTVDPETWEDGSAARRRRGWIGLIRREERASRVPRASSRCRHSSDSGHGLSDAGGCSWNS